GALDEGSGCVQGAASSGGLRYQPAIRLINVIERGGGGSQVAIGMRRRADAGRLAGIDIGAGVHQEAIGRFQGASVRVEAIVDAPVGHLGGGGAGGKPQYHPNQQFAGGCPGSSSLWHSQREECWAEFTRCGSILC
nr:hypothetical protein [Tanacetum cinerariifolium]